MKIYFKKITDSKGLLIKPLKVKPRRNWEAQFKKAKKEGHIPDRELLEGFSNAFDKNN